MSKKKLNKTVWYGSDVDLQGNAILPPLAEGREDLNGIHEGEIYLHNQDDDPGIWVRTNKGNIKRIGFNKKDLDLSEYLKKQVWDTAWELRTTEEGESYIFCKLPFISQYGITLYADGGNIDLPSLYEGIPVDGLTITKREDGTLMLNPNLELGGLDEEALQKYLDDYNYAKITDIDSRINDLVNGAPQAYDTLKEIADVLQGNVNSIGDIITTLGTKADKTYVDTELAKYIPIAGDTEVMGTKNFLNGLKVGGLPISKYEGHDDVIYIDANVVLRGGLTQYAVDPVTIPSIIESLPQAGYESKGVASFSSEYFVIDANGKVSIIPDSVGLNEEELTAWLQNSDYTTKTYVDDTFATKTSLNATNAEVAKKWTQDDDKIANWDTAYSWGNHASAGYFLASNFTKANIAAKLGISDWALAATKPSYTTKEVTEDTNLYFTNQRAINALTDTLKAYVTLKGTQTIEGEKNFTGGLKVNGSPIVYDSENGYWKLQGNLLITGGLTQYVDDGSVDLPNLYDGLPIDGSTIYWEETANGKVLKAQGGGGITSITKDMVIEALGYTPYNSTNPNGYITSAALNGYLPLTGGTMDGGSGIMWGDGGSNSDNYGSYLCVGLDTDASSSLTTQTGKRYNSFLNVGGGIIKSYRFQLASYVGGNNFFYRGYLANQSKWNDWVEIIHSGNIGSQSVNYATSAGNAATASLIKPTSGTYQASTWNPLTSYTKIWGEAFINSAITTSDSGDMIFYLRPSIYNSGTTELCVAIDGDFYAQTGTKKVWHEGNFTPSNYLLASSYTAADVLAKLKTVDGSGSGLNADTLDGLHWNSFMRQFDVITSANTGNALLAGAFRFNTTLTGLPSGATTYGTMLTVRGGNYDTLWQMYGNYNNDSLFYRRGNLTSLASNAWKQIAFIDSNVASATKLQTSRKIWGQDFNGTGNVSGNIVMDNGNNKIFWHNDANNYAINCPLYGSSARLEYKGFSGHGFFAGGGEAVTITSLGNVGIGTDLPTYKLDVVGTGEILNINNTSGGDSGIRFSRGSKTSWTIIAQGGNLIIKDNYSNSVRATFYEVTQGGTISVASNFLAGGGITQYSDIRKKTKLQDVELTLKQVANAPLIEHYYNSDDKKTTHVGSIAQYWAEMNDWFCKLDGDGYYTMEIQNAALASAISVARELERYESKTDKKIRLLKKRINELEDEIEKLKNVA